MKILLPVDGSDYTMRMLSYIATHNQLLGPGHQYTVFTAIPPVPPHATHFLNRSTVEDYYRDQAEQILKPVSEFAIQQGWSFEVSHAPGHAAQAIAEIAKKLKSDLVVMGSHGHSAVVNMVLGSVATGVLARCTMPVLLIR